MSTTFLTLYEAALRSSQGSAEDADQVAAAKAAVNEAYLTTCGDNTIKNRTELTRSYLVRVSALGNLAV